MIEAIPATLVLNKRVIIDIWLDDSLTDVDYSRAVVLTWIDEWHPRLFETAVRALCRRSALLIAVGCEGSEEAFDILLDVTNDAFRLGGPHIMTYNSGTPTTLQGALEDFFVTCMPSSERSAAWSECRIVTFSESAALAVRRSIADIVNADKRPID